MLRDEALLQPETQLELPAEVLGVAPTSGASSLQWPQRGWDDPATLGIWSLAVSVADAESVSIFLLDDKLTTRLGTS